MTRQIADIDSAVDMAERLKKLFVNNKFTHCYIFTGFDEAGKEKAALMIAEHLHCNTQYGFQILNNEGGDSIKIEEIRTLKKDTQYGGYNGWQVNVIKNAQRLTVQAANSLLKLLEEAPENIMFILDVPNHYLLLPTISSRAQIIYFGQGKQTEDAEEEFIPGLAINKFMEFIGNSSESEIINTVENLKLEKTDFYDKMKRLILWLFQEYKKTKDHYYLKVAKIFRTYMKYLERPVNVNTNLLLLMLDIKEMRR
ncbi:MAG: hypothetical protein PHV30_07805 [Candidatus Margulisbacteria bacterium]|nr:hypothetical protein [Candidatus Margulisiibacteriota bacterium]